jgi:hypothetical protein
MPERIHFLQPTDMQGHCCNPYSSDLRNFGVLANLMVPLMVRLSLED